MESRAQQSPVGPSDEPQKHDRHAFIVRIWHEEDEPQGKITSWRGSIEHVGRGNRLYFHNLDGIVRFIREQAEIGSRQSLQWWRSGIEWVRHGLQELRGLFRAPPGK